MSGNTPKILIIVVIVMIILFLVGVGVGASGGLDISVTSVTDSLHDLFGNGLPLNVSEISRAVPDSCLNRSQKQVVIQVGDGTCTIMVSLSSLPFAAARSLNLRLSTGTSVHYTLIVHPVEGKTMTISKDLFYTDKVTDKAQFYQDGGTLTLENCQNSNQSACILTLN